MKCVHTFGTGKHERQADTTLLFEYMYEHIRVPTLGLDLVNINAHTKFGQILSIPFQGIEHKLNSEISQGP